MTVSGECCHIGIHTLYAVMVQMPDMYTFWMKLATGGRVGAGHTGTAFTFMPTS